MPDGDFVAFITATRLTSYNNSGVPEMYTYDVAARAIRCVSCIPDGSPPISPVEGSQNGRFLTDDGRAFFQTEDPLVDQDANGIRDVYEFVQSRPQLISSGTGESQGNEFQPTGLIGVSADGVDAFLSTYEQLVGQDENGFFLKFYDARTGGGFPFDKPPAPCAAADECHGADSSAAAAAPARDDRAARVRRTGEAQEARLQEAESDGQEETALWQEIEAQATGPKWLSARSKRR